MGTLPYMAPEQFIDAKSADHRADIYSFGIILYQMVAGNRYPYLIKSDAPDAAAEFFRAHTDQTPLPVESPLMPVIGRCLQKAPNRRYTTYDAFLSDLSSVARGLQIKLPKVVPVAKEDEELYAQAQSYVALGDKDRALKAIDEYISKYATNECGWTEKGRIHFERAEYAQALAATKKSLEINPYNTHAWNNLGILLNRTSAPITEVKKAFANALQFDPYNTAAMMNLIGPLVLHKEFSEAAKLTAQALKLRPDKPLVRQKAEALIRECLSERYVEAAETLLSGWTAAQPTDTDAWHNLGLISLDKGDPDRAIQCFKRVHELSPQDNFAIVQLAKLCYQKKKTRECLDYCNKLLQRGYEPLLAVGLKARVLNFIGGYEKALDFLQPYLDHNPGNDALWVVLSEIHEYRDNYDAAIKALKCAKRLLERSKGEHKADNLRFVDQKLQQLSAMR
jgi:tetratricopeptide (TPR) repeat protein